MDKKQDSLIRNKILTLSNLDNFCLPESDEEKNLFDFNYELLPNIFLMIFRVLYFYVQNNIILFFFNKLIINYN